MFKVGIIRPNNFVSGGMVKDRHINIPRRLLKKGDNDRVYARLMENEIVIPVKYAKKVSKFLKKEKIKLPNM